MALRDQPYLPLYVQDFLTDEKLCECSAESTGVYIRLLCILHKSEEYGKILLKQKDKLNGKQTFNFASKLLRQMPYPIEIIEKALKELLEEGVINIDGDYLYQKRMVKDNDISLKRAESGKKGGQKTQFASHFAKANNQANSEYEDEYENETVNEDKTKIVPYQEIVNLYHEILPVLPNVIKLSDKRKSQIKARWFETEKTQSLDWWNDFFNLISQSKFLTGNNDRTWKPDLEWITKQENFLKICEGKYNQ